MNRARMSYPQLLVFVVNMTLLGCSASHDSGGANQPRNNSEVPSSIAPKVSDKSNQSNDVDDTDLSEISEAPATPLQSNGTSEKKGKTNHQLSSNKSQLSSAVTNWKTAEVAELTFTVSDATKPTSILTFPERDLSAEYEAWFDSTLEIYAAGDLSKLEFHTKIVGRETGSGLEQQFYLLAEKEDNWPQQNAPLKMQISGIRKWFAEDGPTVFYDIALSGIQSDEGNFDGHATGRVKVGVRSSWLVFENASFQLRPVFDNKKE